MARADRDDVVRLLSGLDGPRPLPEALRASVVSDLEVAAGGLPGDLDGARPVPPAVAARVVAALQRPAHLRRLRIGTAAAVALVVLGLVAAITRPVEDDGDRLAAAPAAGEPATGGSGRRPSSTTTSTSSTTTTSIASPAPGGATVVALDESEPAYARLERFDSCADLLGWVRAAAVEEVTAYGLGTYLAAGPASGDAAPGGGATASPPVAATGAVSGTNVQEAGVDEPDVVETDGRALYVAVDGENVHVVRAGRDPEVVSTIATGDGHRWTSGLVLDGDRLAVLTSRFDGGMPATEVLLFGVGDPSSPVDLGGVALAGGYVDARASEHVLHVVTRSAPGPFAFTYPADGSDAERERALAANRAVVESSTLEQWVPPGVACESVQRPRRASGFTTTVVWTVPFADPSAATSEGILGDAQTVYATADRLVVATTEWGDVQPADGDTTAPAPDGVRSQLHRFALSPAGADYLASGSVPGYVRSSYGVSEHRGFLRVASTEQPPWQAPTTPSSSTVTVLEQRGEELVPVGAVGGLGIGEQIQGVRFLGDLAFVVTFRQVDPLYVVDLSDPTAPRLRGELHVTGFSGYLHPTSPGVLVGVGVEADEAGNVQGGAVSTYDVSDLDRPTLAQRVTRPDTSYGATLDPHAFLHWEPTGMVVVPGYASVVTPDRARYFGVADVFQVEGSSVTLRGRVSHEAHAAESFVLRAVLVEDRLFTVGTGGVLASDASTLAELGWAGY